MPDKPTSVEKSVLRLLRAASIGYFSQDASLKYRWLENPPATWAGAGDIQGKTDDDLLPAGAASVATAAKREVLATGQPRWTEFAVERDWARQYFELFVEAERDDAGEIRGVAGLLLDVTQRRKRLATLEAIIRQSSHRSKNLLAVLQGLAVQTARTAASTEEFIEQYRGRIQSVSRSQDLVLGTSSQDVRLSRLIAAQVEPYVTDAERQLRFQVSDCDLTANAALHVGLALAELAVAAASGGALSKDGGWVSINAEEVDEPRVGAANPCLRLRWAEHGGRSGDLPQGFAQQLLERLIPSALGGRGALSSTEGGPCYELLIASSEFRCS
jgi:two-component sensor histidine kinase